MISSVQSNMIDNYYNVYISKLYSSSNWELSNQILYDMCKKYPHHNNAHEIVAKIWLIGRSYAAAIERRKNAEGYKGDFYYDDVAPALLNIGKTLDSKIDAVNKIKGVDRNSIYDVLDLHSFLMTEFEKLTGLDKRSLASKYLHFHCPDNMFIYDSVASTALRRLVKKDAKRNKAILDVHPEYDTEYTDFCVRFLELRDYISKKYGKNLSVRELDTFLLNYK